MKTYIWGDKYRELVLDDKTNVLTYFENDEKICLTPITNPSERINVMKQFRNKNLPKHVLNQIENHLKGLLNNGNKWLWLNWMNYQNDKTFHLL